MKLRVLIADDDPLSRTQLRRLVGAQPGTELIAECHNGLDAVAAIRQQAPNVVFLEVTIPKLDGFAVMAAVQISPGPAFICLAAHDHFAVRAFDAHAVDYLLKPFDPERLQTALQRARERLQHPFAGLGGLPLPNALLQPLPLERITVKSGRRLTVLRTLEIDWAVAADNYVELHVQKGTHLVRMTLTALAGQLCPSQFLRVSRSHLVNVARVEEIHRKSHGDYVVVMRDGSRLPGSRSYRHSLGRLLGSPAEARRSLA